MATAGEILRKARSEGKSSWSDLGKAVGSKGKSSSKKTSSYDAQKAYDAALKKQREARARTEANTKAEERRIQQQKVSQDVNTALGNGQATAWQYITKQYDDSSWLGKLYQKVDYGLGGWLPSGIPRTIVKAADAELSTERKAYQVRAEQQQQLVSTQLDYADKTWYESLGFAYPKAEKAYQERQQSVIDTSLLTGQTPDFGTDFTRLGTNISSPISEGLGTGLKYGIPLLIGGLLAVQVMKK